MICDTCGKYPCDMDGTKLWHHCFAYSPKPKLITNADRIRAMGDIELGNFLSGLILGCSDCPMYEECDGANCNSRWQKWLKEEADDGLHT